MKFNHPRWKSVALAAAIALFPGSPGWGQNRSPGVTIDQHGFARSIGDATLPNASRGGGNIDAVGLDPAQTGPAFLVTTTDDHDDGVCDADCTLRDALHAAATSSDPATITFGSTVRGTITLTLFSLPVSRSTNIIGPGARLLAISGDNVTSVFYFSGTVSPTSTLSGLTIRDGASIRQPGSGDVATGSGVFTARNHTLTISDCAFVNNHSQGGDNTTDGGTGGNAVGGAICNTGTLTLNRCTFTGNMAQGGHGGDGATPGTAGGAGGYAGGAGVFNDTKSSLTINACSFGNNIASGGAGGNGMSGGNGGDGGKAAGGRVQPRNDDRDRRDL